MAETKLLGTTGRPIRVLFVEDQQMLAHFLVHWVAKQPGFELVGCTADGESALRLCAERQPDVAVVDIELPDWDGLELAKELLARMPEVRILSMSGRTDPYTIWRVRESGLHGYLDKGQNPMLLEKAIFAVAGGGAYFSSAFAKVKEERLGDAASFHKILSDREQAVLQGVVNGLSDEEIADKLTISVSTVSVHRKHIRQKLELHNDRELIAYARRWGLHSAPAPMLSHT